MLTQILSYTLWKVFDWRQWQAMTGQTPLCVQLFDQHLGIFPASNWDVEVFRCRSTPSLSRPSGHHWIVSGWFGLTIWVPIVEYFAVSYSVNHTMWSFIKMWMWVAFPFISSIETALFSIYSTSHYCIAHAAFKDEHVWICFLRSSLQPFRVICRRASPSFWTCVTEQQVDCVDFLQDWGQLANK